MGLKKNLRRFLNHRFGWDIVRYSPGPSDISWWITQCDTDLVLDVGANVGQFALPLIKMGYKGRIVSFEPSAAVHERLLGSAKPYPQWEVAERCALGDADGEITIHVSRDSLGNSALAGTKALHDLSEDSHPIGSEKVRMYRLSTIAPRYLDGSRSAFLKIDVQGFEDKVLDGAEQILPRIKGLQLELSFDTLYEGQLLMEDMLKKIKRSGFYLHTLKPFCRTATGRDLQAEAIFFRNGYAPKKQT